MKRAFNIGALLAVATLTACGGGGSTAGSPIPIPTNQPPVANSVAIRWTGTGHSIGTQTQSLFRYPMSSAPTVQSEPIEVAPSAPCAAGQPGCSSLNSQYNVDLAGIMVSEVNATGTPVPAPTPAVTAASDATVTPAILGSPPPGAPTPAPNVAQFALTSTASSQAQSTLNVTYPNGGPTATLPIKVFNFFALENPVKHSDSTQAYVASNSVLVSTTDIPKADVYLSLDNGVMNVHAPLGYQLLAPTTAIGSVTTAVPFVTAGTTIPVSSLSSGPVVIVALHGGGYAAIKIGTTYCSYTSTPANCDVAAQSVGLQKVSDGAGNFSI